jgi:ketosteroid isomerase-like protein
MGPLEIVQGVYASHVRRDTGGLVELLADDIAWWQARNHPYANPAGPWIGKADVVAHVVDPINNEWHGFITRVDAILDAGEQVVVHGEYTGTYKATGRDIAAPVCAIYTVRNGAITEFRQYVDTAQIRWAMGTDDRALLVPDPAQLT